MCLNDTLVNLPIGNPMFIRKDIPFLYLHLTTDLNMFAIEIYANGPLIICSIYLSSISRLFILLGDFNARYCTSRVLIVMF